MRNHELRRLFQFCPLALILCASTTFAETKEAQDPVDARLIESLKNTIPFLMGQNPTPGLNIALARHGKVIWEAGFGFADLEKKIPMAANTVFHSGSIGKTFTATATMQLVEQGVIGLHDPVNKYFKTLKVTNPLGEREVTAYDLLTHRSGLAENAAACDFNAPEPLEAYIVHAYAKPTSEGYGDHYVRRWTAKVGEKYQYSNLGMSTLGYLVQVTNREGLSFSDYVQRHIIDPLGMKSTQFPPVQDAAHVRKDIFNRMSKGYAVFGEVFVPTPTIYIGDYPAGTVVGTPGDLLHLALAFANHGNYNGYQLLKPETVRLMLTPQQKLAGNVQGGFVWRLIDVGQPDFNFEHSGAHMFGWTNDYRAYPEQDFAVAVATNSWNMGVDLRSVAPPIEDFISAWLKYEKAGAHKTAREPHTWSWKTSYVMGMVMVERIKGGLGINRPITPELVGAMSSGTRLSELSTRAKEDWDPAGFRAGVEDMLKVEMKPAALKAFVESDRIRINPEELLPISKQLGATVSLLPWALLQ